MRYRENGNMGASNLFEAVAVRGVDDEHNEVGLGRALVGFGYDMDRECRLESLTDLCPAVSLSAHCDLLAVRHHALSLAGS